jgi:cytochrome c biogenesis protein CcdA
VFDLVSQSAQAVAQRSLYAPPLILLAGVLTSVGPCTAPRLIAAAGIATGDPAQQRLHCAVFVAGLMSGYAALGVVGSALGFASAYSREIDLALAISLAVAAIWNLLRQDTTHDCSCPRDAKRSAGATFLLGASFASVISPCCTPVVAGILAYSGGTGSPAFAAICLASFALGHAAPLVAVAATGAHLTSFVRRLRLGEAVQTMSGGLTLALAAYYGVVA